MNRCATSHLDDEQTSRGTHVVHLDGLRGVAIVLVVLFHTGVPGLARGFIGVDVFFVLSGFLIFGLIRREILARGRVSWVEFYGRRAARLVPALLLLVLVMSVLSFVLLSPGGERQGASKAMVAALVSGGNVYYWKFAQVSYFAPTQGAGALVLHTWSLGVEEQFYLLLPAGFFVAGWLAKRHGTSLLRVVRALLVAGTGASIVVAWWLSQSHPAAGFYLLPARAYELGAGALLALAMPIGLVRTRLKALCGLLGAVLLAGALLLDVPEDRFPGLWALVPVTAAVGLIVGGGRVHVIAAILSSRPLVYAGRISYGWYLWHWPLLVLADLLYVAPAPMSWRLLAVLMAFVVAAASHRWWEAPMRRAGRARPKAALSCGLAAVVTAVLLPLGVGAHAKFMGPTGDWGDLLAQQNDYVRLPSQCTDSATSTAATGMRRADRLCVLSSGESRDDRRVVVWGDSHAWAWLPAVTLAVRDRAAVEDASYPGCPPGVTSVSVNPPSEADREAQEVCARSNRSVLAELEHGGVGDVVVIAARWAVQLGADPYSLVDRPLFSDRSDWRLPADVVRSEVTAAVRDLTSQGIRVVIIRPVPELRRPAPACLASAIFHDDCDEPLDVEVDFARSANQFLTTLGGLPGVDVVDPVPWMCDATLCHVRAAGTVRYIDDDHISASFSRSMAPMLEGVLEAALDLGDASPATALGTSAQGSESFS